MDHRITPLQSAKTVVTIENPKYTYVLYSFLWLLKISVMREKQLLTPKATLSHIKIREIILHHLF